MNDYTSNVLELFGGSSSIGKVAKSLGMNVFSIDNQKFEHTDLVQDVEFLEYEQIPFTPDVIWASIPCTTYSMAAISHHRDNGEPKTDFAAKSDRLALKTLAIIQFYLKINPNLKFFIENPRAYLRKMPFMLGIPKTTVWYCRYGDMRAKPTDIWSNHIYSIFQPNGWQPRPECKNGNKNCHHQAAPRGSKTGTQGLKNKFERSKIPPLLCREILESC